MDIYTIGFTKKTAKQFFEPIKEANIKLLIDVRLNNQSQLAGFTKGKDLVYLLQQICNCDYVHELKFAPSKELLDNYKKGVISWNQYEPEYYKQFTENKMSEIFKAKYSINNKLVFLCSEPTSDNCHRRLLAENLKKLMPEINIIHL